jgi:hypothetical protein
LETAKRRPGRPAREPHPGERVGLSLRVTPETKLSLEVAATTSGRSLSQEAEFRLEQSFRPARFRAEILETAFGPQGAALMLLLGRLMRHSPGYRNVSIESDWLDDPDAFAHAETEIQTALSVLRPPGDPLPQTMPHAKNMAEMTMRDLAEAADDQRYPRTWAADLREGLGTAVVRRLERWVECWNSRNETRGPS